MTVRDLAQRLGAEILVEGELDRPVTAGYAGDLLSWVMARAQSGNVWLTVMGNINAIAVATLTDVACIVLAENAALDKEAAQRAELQGIPVYSCAENLYDTAVRVYETLK